MLPFGGYEFFVLMAVFIGFTWLLKLRLKDPSYRIVLAVFNALFLVFFYPQPLHFFLLIGYAYGMTWLLSNVLQPAKKIWGILLLLLPMLLVKFGIKVHYYPFELNNILSFAGLSYACFRIVGYYNERRNGEPMPDVLSYFNFLSFTPTLLIGPIDRYSHFTASQSRGFSNLNEANATDGWNQLVKGVAFKFIVAECIDRYWLNIFAAEDIRPVAMLNTMYAYYAYLFFDFAGYSFMALGVGKLMGMEVPLNFTNPFLAVNPQDFWRRFHISLGDWLKENFFNPLYLFLTRKKKLKAYPLLRQNVALLLTFTLMGCWNGFKKHYVLSGLLFGLYSVVHNTYLVKSKQAGRDIVFGDLDPKWIRIISIFIMLNLVAFALYVFSGRFPLIQHS
ncbi:MAG: MBOAT family O-acyltransferase [Bacteroidota bacterium]